MMKLDKVKIGQVIINKYDDPSKYNTVGYISIKIGQNRYFTAARIDLDNITHDMKSNFCYSEKQMAMQDNYELGTIEMISEDKRKSIIVSVFGG